MVQSACVHGDHDFCGAGLRIRHLVQLEASGDPLVNELKRLHAQKLMIIPTNAESEQGVGCLSLFPSRFSRFSGSPARCRTSI